MRKEQQHDADLDSGRDEKTFKIFLGQTGAPAFMRRAQRVADAEEQLLSRCAQQRQEWTSIARSRLGMLRALAGNWEKLAKRHTVDIDALRQLESMLSPPEFTWQNESRSKSALALAVQELAESIGRFNERWQRFLESVDLSEVNELRANYNRYYVLEKECITRSPRLARQGFTPLPPITHADLFTRFPLLPMFT